MDPLVVGAAVRDDDGGLVPDLAPDAGGGVGLGVGRPAREVLRSGETFFSYPMVVLRGYGLRDIGCSASV